MNPSNIMNTSSHISLMKFKYIKHCKVTHLYCSKTSQSLWKPAYNKLTFWLNKTLVITQTTEETTSLNNSKVFSSKC